MKASCLCGRVTFQIAGAIHSPRFCHCANCRKFSGTAYAAWGLVQAAQLELAASNGDVTKYDSGGGLRVFCTTCGSPLWYEPAALPQFRGIPLGIVEGADVPAPVMHVWTQSKVPWVALTDDLPQNETHP
jgi:hypothetical protein